MKNLIAAALSSTLLAGCAGMTDTQQRATTGTLAGAGVGAVAGAIGGNAGLGAVAGAGAGLVGGLLVDHAKKSEEAAYKQGYTAGKSGS
jgi:predicted Zn-dependent protease